MNRRELLRFLGAAAACSIATRFASAQGPLTVQPLGNRLHMLSGAGGNITILQADDGLLLVDSGLPNTGAAVASKVKEAAPQPVQHLINTHWHYDHVGGNEIFGSAGARILAHQNCAKRLTTLQHVAFFNHDYGPMPAAGQPKQTFSDKGDLTFAGEHIEYTYFPPAHTDGDITVHFANTDVYSTGDLFFCGMYPFIDYSTGGSIEGMIRNAEAMLKVVTEKTKIVPGHGPLGTTADLQRAHDMLVDVNQRVSKLIDSGKSVDELLAAKPTDKYDEQWGNGFLKPADWLKMLYQGKTGKASAAAA